MLKDFADIKEHIAQLRASQNTGSTNLHEQDDALRQLEVSFEFWARWVRTYLERTNICINLVHHLQNQDIAIQAHRESVSVFTLSIVTALFLPGTFVAVSQPSPTLFKIHIILQGEGIFY
ncbi:hypothetical protein MGN70_004616 [Eutypa lata]|nr:hypothetical protein MGN70_004616 [Eutypa lata]